MAFMITLLPVETPPTVGGTFPTRTSPVTKAEQRGVHLEDLPGPFLLLVVDLVVERIALGIRAIDIGEIVPDDADRVGSAAPCARAGAVHLRTEWYVAVARLVGAAGILGHVDPVLRLDLAAELLLGRAQRAEGRGRVEAGVIVVAVNRVVDVQLD